MTDSSLAGSNRLAYPDRFRAEGLSSLGTRRMSLDASSVILGILFSLIFISILNLLRGDELTGTAEDSKDILIEEMAPAKAPVASGFLPLPAWSHFVSMPPLPDQLKPTGKKITVEAPAAPAPAPLEPPKDAQVAATPAATDTTARPRPAPSPADNPAFVTVSPFLQWIKSNPQAAAAVARQQAGTYRGPATPEPGAPAANGGTEDPYWLPPMIDSTDATAKPVTGSSAIYTTPQR